MGWKVLACVYACMYVWVCARFHCVLHMYIKLSHSPPHSASEYTVLMLFCNCLT